MASFLNLSQREVEILRLVLEGQTNKAIAAELWITEKTVEFHLDRIYIKIGMPTRWKPNIWVLQQGLDVETREIPS